MASYLDSKPSGIKIMEAIRYHFPISVQGAMLSMQLTSIREALDLLKRIEIMKTHETYNKGQSLNSAHGYNSRRLEST
jgi:hypothetical protein